MARKRKHKDVEFMIEDFGSGNAKHDGWYLAHGHAYFETSADAVEHAVGKSMSRGGEPVFVDVLVSSRAGAAWYGGDWAEEEYDEDPDASVFDRIEIRATSHGRIR
jgi:hypothetical protein